MKRLSFYCAVAWAATAACAWAQVAGEAATTQVVLQPQAQARGDTVTLGDVATIRSGDLAALRRLVAVPIGSAPRAGASQTVGQAALQRWVRRQAGAWANSIAWSGADTVQVLGAASSTTASTTANAAPLQGAVPGPAPALVPQGAWVAISLKVGALELESRGRALQAAGLGEPVKVQPAGSGEPINARVVAPGRVEALL